MKKTIFIAGLIVLALGMLSAGVAFAQGELPPLPGRMGMMQGGHGWMHVYVQQALAAKLDLSVEDVQEQLASGKTMYQVALDHGIPQADLQDFMTEVHREAFAQAVKDGAVPQAQADAMLQRMQTMHQGGLGTGNCPMHNGQGGGMMGSGMMQGIQTP